MNEPAFQNDSFKVDTHHPRSRSKRRSKIRHILAVASGMFPLMALFIFLMSMFRLPLERGRYYNLALLFVACGMVTLLFYAWTRAEKSRRREVSASNRELRLRRREEALRQEQARIQDWKTAAISKED